MWKPACTHSILQVLTITAAVVALAAFPRLCLASTEEHGHGAEVEQQAGHNEGLHEEGGQTAHGGGHQVQHLDNWFNLSFGPDKEHKNGPLAFAILNFAILVWLLLKFGKKPFQDFLVQRSTSVGRDLKAAAELHQKAREKLIQIESKLKALNQEIQEIKDNVAQDAQLEKERILKAAEAEADRIIQQADQTLSNELRRARRTLETEAVEAAMAAAEKLIKQQINASDHKHLNDEYFSQISSSGGNN